MQESLCTLALQLVKNPQAIITQQTAFNTNCQCSVLAMSNHNRTGNRNQAELTFNLQIVNDVTPIINTMCLKQLLVSIKQCGCHLAVHQRGQSCLAPKLFIRKVVYLSITVNLLEATLATPQLGGAMSFFSNAELPGILRNLVEEITMLGYSGLHKHRIKVDDYSVKHFTLKTSV